MKTKIIYILILLAIVVTSCEKDLKIKIDAPDPKLVMNSHIEADSIIKVFVSKSTFALIDDEDTLVKDATVTIDINGNIEQMTNIYNRLKSTAEYRSNTTPKAGDRIKIEASAKGFKTIYSEIVVPDNKVDIVDAKYMILPKSSDKFSPTFDRGSEYNSIKRYWNYKYYTYPDDNHLKVDLKIKKKSKEDIFFMIKIKRRYDMYYTDYNISKEEDFMSKVKIKETTDESYMDIIFDPKLTRLLGDKLIGAIYERKMIVPYALFDNSLFDGDEYNFSFALRGNDYKTSVYNYYTEKTIFEQTQSPIIIVEIHALTDEMYRHLQRKLIDARLDNPIQIFPAQSISNVVNGIGIIGASSVAISQLEININK